MVATSPRGTFRSIAEELRGELTGEGAIERVPPESELSARFGVARGTVRKALAVLRDEGLIEPVHGLGWRRTAGADRRPLVERIEAVIRADMKPGDVFLSEAKLCERLGASRVAVRSAVAQLEGRGLLEARPGKPRLVRALPDKTSES
ncbi:hypothetical protein SRB5_51840 [Streptomyces sp. RB5]|uniref:HTH gntR-type domain-containing protein n=1 Tax=Streptomyces smaragdinus TaxID=2585196 RepID=A0A7K0CND4_9ACTN|nr:GntR family transcriptional regulator [Streptomyces smaragdinus]MQY15007.1 hypothetical protein [Streptomyces smaragdinus]